MNDLETAILQAIATEGAQKEANKAYLEFLKANFIIPIEKHSKTADPEVLFLVENDTVFLPVFTNPMALQNWAKDIGDEIQILKLSGVDLLKGIGENISVCLNIGEPSHKIFNPSEIARLRSMVLKLFK